MPMLPAAAARRPAAAQDRREHLHGRRLAVGAGDGEPRRGAVRAAQPPGELDLAPDRDAGRRGRGEQRLVGPPAGRGDDELGAVAAARRPSLAEPDVDAERSRRLGRARCSRASPSRPSTTVTRGAALEQGVGGGEAGDAEAGDDDAQPGPVGVAVGQRVEPAVRSLTRPTTHSA